MSLKLLVFSLGVIAFSFSPQLLSLWWIALLIPIFLSALVWPRLWFVLAFGLGLAWGLTAGHDLVDQQLPEALVGQDLQVTGHISGLPERDSRRLRFDFRPVSVVDARGKPLAQADMPDKLQLSWYLPSGYGDFADKEAAAAVLPALVIGEYWQLRVRLKRPRGFVNPAGFDYQAWLLRQGIGATGYVLASSDNQALAAPRQIFHWQDWINQRRQKLQEWVVENTGSSERGILVALLIGDSALVEKEQWQRMQQTGTSHLIAISGLHVGFLAIFGFYAGLLLGKCVQLVWHACPALVFAWLGALMCAGFYSALAGFNIPTMRTFIMLGLFYAACLARRQIAISDIFCWSLALIVLLDPLAAYDMGFWLSFGAVALLLVYFSGRLIAKSSPQPWTGFSPKDALIGFIRSQWVMFIGLVLPLSLLVSTVSLVAPIANAIAIPLITFLVVPLLLIGAALGDSWLLASKALLSMAAGTMEYLAQFLDFLLAHAGSWASPLVVFSPWLLPLLALSITAILLPRGLLPRQFALLGLVLVAGLNFFVAPPKPDDLKITFLDVGQGTAIVVQVGSRTLVYDTGPQYTRSFDAGSAIVAPYLQAQGISAIDVLVISHRDMDHAGGLKGLLDKMRVETLYEGELGRGSNLSANTPQARNCHETPPWDWQGIGFRFLTASVYLRHKSNNQSCVLLISYGDQHILLPGDIETSVEHQLLYTGQVPSEMALVAAAHHGSRSSSGELWVKHTKPRYVVYSAAYRSQHGHPHPQIKARYAAIGSTAFNTAEQGALIFRWRNEQLLAVELRRETARRYWFDE
ncbi:DNA internalization-related competence protein ComEC/Rec2 [Cellvibrio fontiphilus]|uniref:DNA internalization-related competence protein ComEC/Rec2 n=1 Tax=Cellvibrio fontiphilus TaxID=1815559 RepID=A0ABV7FJN2_9GAMM